MGEPAADELEETSTPKYVNHLVVHPFGYFSVSRQKQERNVLEALLRMVPGLKERLIGRTSGDVANIAEKVSR